MVNAAIVDNEHVQEIEAIKELAEALDFKRGPVWNRIEPTLMIVPERVRENYGKALAMGLGETQVKVMIETGSRSDLLEVAYWLRHTSERLGRAHQQAAAAGFYDLFGQGSLEKTSAISGARTLAGNAIKWAGEYGPGLVSEIQTAMAAAEAAIRRTAIGEGARNRIENAIKGLRENNNLELEKDRRFMAVYGCEQAFACATIGGLEGIEALLGEKPQNMPKVVAETISDLLVSEGRKAAAEGNGQYASRYNALAISYAASAGLRKTVSVMLKTTFG